MPKVVNMHYHKPTPKDIYIGRSRIGEPYNPLCNEYSHLPNTRAKHQVATRQEAVDKFRIDLKFRIASGDKELIEALRKIDKDSILVCFCAPQLCHGNEIIKVLEETNYLGKYKE